MLAAKSGVEGAIRLSDSPVLLLKYEMAYALPHLALRLFNEQRLAHSHKVRTSTAGDTGDMGGDESRIGGGGDNGGVHSGLI